MSAFILLFKNINKKKKVSSVNRHLSVVEVCPSATRGFLWGLSRQLCQKKTKQKKTFSHDPLRKYQRIQEQGYQGPTLEPGLGMSLKEGLAHWVQQ